MKVAITGGAGFIGRHVVSALLKLKQVRAIKVLDSFDDQVHDSEAADHFVAEFPGVKLRVGDVCNKSDVMWLIDQADVVIHLAAQTGTGQSMYEPVRYTHDNVLGTANLLQCLTESKRVLKKFILASSRSVYGEGQYEACGRCLTQPANVTLRSQQNMKNGIFDPVCSKCGNTLKSAATRECCFKAPLSYYAETKLIQERQVSLYNKRLFEELVIFRFQNVYGEGQSLSNPYTGILAIFSTLAKANSEINIFEDGLESRDFVHVSDVASTIGSAIVCPDNTFDGIFNLGTGVAVSVIQVAESISKYFNSSSVLGISGDFRVGDIRHNYADVELLNSSGIKTRDFIPFDEGLLRFLESISNISSNTDGYIQSIAELKNAGMFISAKKH